MSMNNRNGHQLGAGVALARKQKGMSFLAMFAVVAVVVFLAMFAFKVGPSYMEFMTVKTIAEDVSNNPDLLKGPKSNVVKYIDQSYRTNNLWDLKASETIDLQKDGRLGYVITVNYEKRANLFANIDVVTVFNKSVNGEE